MWRSDRQINRLKDGRNAIGNTVRSIAACCKTGDLNSLTYDRSIFSRHWTFQRSCKLMLTFPRKCLQGHGVSNLRHWVDNQVCVVACIDHYTYRYCICPKRSKTSGVAFSRPWKCPYSIPTFTVAFPSQTWIYTVSQKVPTFKLSISLSKLNWFSNIWHCWKAYKICYKTIRHCPPHLKHVATLPGN